MHREILNKYLIFPRLFLWDAEKNSQLSFLTSKSTSNSKIGDVSKRIIPLLSHLWTSFHFVNLWMEGCILSSSNIHNCEESNHNYQWTIRRQRRFKKIVPRWRNKHGGRERYVSLIQSVWRGMPRCLWRGLFYRSFRMKTRIIRASRLVKRIRRPWNISKPYLCVQYVQGIDARILWLLIMGRG